MRLLSLQKIADNMVLARNVYAREGNVLLAKDSPLKRHYIERLLDWGVNSVYVRDDQGDLLVIDEELCRQAQEELLQLTKEFFATLDCGQLPAASRQMIDGVIGELSTDDHILWNLVEIKAGNDDLFRHSVKVCVLAMIMGTFNGYDVPRLKELATGALLMDAGKTELPHHLLAEPNLLSNQENSELQEHTRLGYDKLRKLHGNYDNATQVVLQHHEKYDGTGFPQGLKGDQIHEYARITAIADAFLGRQAKGGHTNPDLIIENGSGTLFDPGLVRLFSQKIIPLWSHNEVNVSEPATQPEPSLELPQSTATSAPSNHRIEIKPKSAAETEYQEKIGRPSLFARMFGHKGSKDSPKKDNTTPNGREHLVNNRHFKVGDWEDHSSHINSHHEAEINKFVVYPEWREPTKEEVLKIVAKTLSRIGADLVPKVVLERTRATVGELMNDDEVVSNLVMIRELDDQIFTHCVAVGFLSVMTGVSLGFSPEQLKELGTGSFLVDLGEVEISRKYNVDSRWLGTAEYAALMPEHTQLGFEKLWEMRCDSNIPYVALQHHEHYDGSGFPTGIKGDQINELARIAALADAYDTLIHKGMNGQKMMPHEVIEYIRDNSGSHFDPQFSQVFLKNVTPFLIGSNVLLNTGEKAKVIKINKDLLARPIVRVILDKEGKELPQSIVKDLAEDLTLFIKSALKDDEF